MSDKNIQLKDLVKGKEPVPMHGIFTVQEERSESSRNHGASFSLVLMSSEYQNEEKDIQLLKTFVNGLNNKLSETKLRSVTLPIGNGSLKGVYFNLTSRSEYLGTRLTLIKNYGCYNLAFIANYNTDEQLEKIKSILASASISKF